MKILIIDDEVEILQGILNGVNWARLEFSEVLVATGVEKAREILEKQMADLVLCDIEMPDGTGLDLIGWVKEYFPDTMCVILTCHVDFSYCRRALEMGCVDYLLKPIEYPVLQEKLQQYLTKLYADRENTHYQKLGKDVHRQISQAADHSTQDKDGIIEQVKAYVRDHLQEDIRIEELAARVYITSDYLTRIFKKREGITPMEFVQEERMFLAAHLLKESSFAVSKVAFECGYDNFSYFGKIFRKKYGLSPRDYRKKYSMISEESN